ncbi:hypothetical protein CP556_05545 [Natrinema sp. CBA1119]|uniref:hypothetical protein n=1 Tax=Natrinema sp. CBA1119 TaxID=1608465 RepID=UPI000BF3EBAF|nr:hypothetical protein [Natrinema sp. CBA1119]PGF15636.1 hypothetical protein CP556_05545 [Natrinema sp. CBA1119]
MTMERKKSKFLYDFLPGATFNHSETNLSGLITRLHPDDDGHGHDVVPDLPDQYILRRIQRHANKWTNWQELDFNPTEVSIVQPGAANFEVFPRTFACGNCGTANQFHYNEINEFPGGGQTPNCQRCGTPMHDHDQMRFAAVCSCGQIQDIYVPKHCGAGMEFRESGVRLTDSYWRCTDQNCKHTEEFNTGGKCFNQGCDRNDLKVLPHSASTTFYPQTQTLVNVRQDLDTLRTNGQYQTQIVSDYLLDEAQLGEPDPDKVMDLAIDLLQSGEAESNEQARELAKERLRIDISDHRNQTDQFLRQQFNDRQRVQVSEELFEYLSMTSETYDEEGYIYSYTLEELAAGEHETHLESKLLQEYLAERDQRNLSTVRLIKNFPITVVTYGYTRLSPEPSGGFGEDDPSDGATPPALNLFRSGKWADVEIFARTNDAEAVMFTLDHDAVFEWLTANFDVDAEASDLKEWYLTQVTNPGRFGAINPAEEPVSRAVFSLLHTYSHAVIEAIGALSGYGRESLVEHLLPRTLSTVIYKRADTDYSLGSIFTLFEDRFLDVMDQLEEAAFCTYDTICQADHNGACEDCLFLSNITCTNSNKNLSRSLLFGGEFDGQSIDGYL